MSLFKNLKPAVCNTVTPVTLVTPNFNDTRVCDNQVPALNGAEIHLQTSPKKGVTGVTSVTVLQKCVRSQFDTDLASAMAGAISRLGEMTPDDLLERIDRDRKLSSERRRIASMPLDSVAGIEAWFYAWRVLIAEVTIDRANEGVGHVR